MYIVTGFVEFCLCRCRDMLLRCKIPIRVYDIVIPIVWNALTDKSFYCMASWKDHSVADVESVAVDIYTSRVSVTGRVAPPKLLQISSKLSPTKVITLIRTEEESETKEDSEAIPVALAFWPLSKNVLISNRGNTQVPWCCCPSLTKDYHKQALLQVGTTLLCTLYLWTRSEKWLEVLQMMLEILYQNNITVVGSMGLSLFCWSSFWVTKIHISSFINLNSSSPFHRFLTLGSMNVMNIVRWIKNKVEHTWMRIRL